MKILATAAFNWSKAHFAHIAMKGKIPETADSLQIIKQRYPHPLLKER